MDRTHQEFNLRESCSCSCHDLGSLAFCLHSDFLGMRTGRIKNLNFEKVAAAAPILWDHWHFGPCSNFLGMIVSNL